VTKKDLPVLWIQVLIVLVSCNYGYSNVQRESLLRLQVVDIISVAHSSISLGR